MKQVSLNASDLAVHRVDICLGNLIGQRDVDVVVGTHDTTREPVSQPIVTVLRSDLVELYTVDESGEVVFKTTTVESFHASFFCQLVHVVHVLTKFLRCCYSFT